MYTIILSYDIKNEKGESVLKDNVTNAVSHLLDEKTATQFDAGIAKGRLAQFLCHFLATGFVSPLPDVKRWGVFPEVIKCNYEIHLPAKHPVLQYHHSNTEVDNNIGLGALREYPLGSAVKLSPDDQSQ